MESFNGRLRDEFLAVEQFDSLLEAHVLIEDWRIEYNTLDSHKRWSRERGPVNRASRAVHQ